MFVSISNLYYNIITSSKEEFLILKKKTNRAIEIFSIATKQMLFVQFKNIITVDLINEINKSINKITEKLLFKEEERWLFYSNFGQRVIYAQILDLFNFFGIRSSLMYIYIL